MNEMFRDAGDELASIQDDIRIGAFKMATLPQLQQRCHCDGIGFGTILDIRPVEAAIRTPENTMVRVRFDAGKTTWKSLRKVELIDPPLNPAIGIIAPESGESDVNTELLTIQVKCTSCDKVKPATICAEELDDYTLNEDGETYTSLYGECGECLAGDSSEDRLERQAQAHLESAALHRDDPMF